MRKNQTSLTAAGIAVMRAVESDKPADERICYDPYARQFIPVWMYYVLGFFIKSGYTKDGVPRGVRGRAYYTKRTMTSDQCAKIVLNAAEKRRREVLLGPGALAVWLKVIAPGFLDWFAVKVFLGVAVRRAKAKIVEGSTP